jgi:hypothetical protein
MSPVTKILAASVAVLALGSGVASAGGPPPKHEDIGKAGVRFVAPPSQVSVGHGRNVPVGVRFTRRARQVGVRAVVVKLLRVGGNPRVHAGKVVFRPDGTGNKHLRDALTVHNQGDYIVRYEVLIGPSVSKGSRQHRDYELTATAAG